VRLEIWAVEILQSKTSTTNGNSLAATFPLVEIFSTSTALKKFLHQKVGSVM